MKIPASVGPDTRLFGVLGHPVRHSKSPAMQTAALQKMGIDACYLAFEVAPEAIGEALFGSWALGFEGINLTVPHKVSALDYVAEVDDGAKIIGATNTLVRAMGGWKAYNTDAGGLVDAVKEEVGFDPKGRSVLILGTGGAARAAVVGLANAGVKKILITGRNKEAACELAREFGEKLAFGLVSEIALEDAQGSLSAGDLLVSATPLGLSPEGRWPFAMDKFDKGVLVYDMAYGDGPTSLEAAAKAARLKVASGAGMLLYQGVRALKLWTGKEVPVDLMRKALLGL